MSLTIYTTGSAEFLEIMLNSTAMITGSGTAEDLARIGMIIGVLLLAFQAVFNNQGISFQKAGVVLALYMMFYGPTDTAVIEDTTSGQVRVVDNVPLGPLAVGWVISSVAYEITKISEQAYSTPAMTDYGLFSSLNTIARTRDALRNPMALDSFANRPGWDLTKSLQEYMTFCLLNPIALRNYTSVTELYRSGSFSELMQTPLQSQYMYLYNPNPTLVSCPVAQQELSNVLTAAFGEVFEDILNKGFAPERESGRMTSQYQVEAALNDSIQSMAISSKNAQEYVKTSTVMPIFNDARVDALNHWQEKNSAMALRQAINHQELQWAAKGDMFKHYMRPMIAFFEGLLYAMTPFMAFALLLGGPGLKVMGKYLILPIAVGLWMPLLSVVNAFTLWYASAEIGAILNSYDATGQGFAMMQVLEMDQAISKAMGIGGLLAASVPPLALFIVSGSAMVANGIMSQASQASTFKSQEIMPEAKKQAAVLDTTSSFTSDQVTTGAAVTGARAIAPKISADQTAQAVMQSAETASYTASQGLQSNITSATQELMSTSSGRQALAQLGKQMSASLNLSNNADYSSSTNSLKAMGFSEDTIAAGAYASGLNPGIPGVASASLRNSQEFKQLSKEEQRMATEQMAKLSDAVQSTLQGQDSYSATDAFVSNQQAMSQASNSEEISKSISEVRAAQQTYNEASSWAESLSGKQDMDLASAARKAINRSGVTSDVAARGVSDLAGKTVEDQEAIRRIRDSETIRSITQDENERTVAASMLHMMNTGRLSELAGSVYTPFDFTVNSGNAASNAHIADQPINTGDLESELASRRNQVAEGYTDMRSFNDDGWAAYVESGADRVREYAEENSNKAREFFDHESGRVAASQDVRKVDNDMVKSTTPVSDNVETLKAIGKRGIRNLFE